MPLPEFLRPVLPFVLALLLAAALPLQAMAVNPDEMLSDPVLEERARELSAEIRCMKCQNQSIDDSDAELASDLRILVRERIVAGDSDQQVLDYLVDRYGEFVLLKPRLTGTNLLLWGAPMLALLAALFFAWRAFARLPRRRQDVSAAPAALSREEQERLTKILDERD